MKLRWSTVGVTTDVAGAFSMTVCCSVPPPGDHEAADLAGLREEAGGEGTLEEEGEVGGASPTRSGGVASPTAHQHRHQTARWPR